MKDVSRGDMTARYDQDLECWVFHCSGIEFHFRAHAFDESAFDWARDSVVVIRALESEIRKLVLECLADCPCDKTKAEMLCVELDEYPDSKTIDIAFVGDESWGDYGVNVIICDGKIVEAHGGD